MTDVRDFKTYKGRAQALCEYCGQPEHPAPLSCPRIRSITYNSETDDMTVRFWGPDETPALPEAS